MERYRIHFSNPSSTTYTESLEVIFVAARGCFRVEHYVRCAELYVAQVLIWDVWYSLAGKSKNGKPRLSLNIRLPRDTKWHRDMATEILDTTLFGLSDN